MQTASATTKHDWLAVIYIAGGSSWGRAPNKDEAIRRAMASFRDWEAIFKFERHDIRIQVTDVQGYGECWWDHSGMQGVNEATGKSEKIERPQEYVSRTFIPKRRK